MEDAKMDEKIASYINENLGSSLSNRILESFAVLNIEEMIRKDLVKKLFNFFFDTDALPKLS
jgi:hypothetical protein